MNTLDLYLPIAIYAVLVLIVFVVAILIPKLIAPGGPLAVVDKRHPPVEVYKYETYECAEIPIGDARKRFDIEYYIFPLVFLLFDVVSVFLYLWAVIYLSLPYYVSVYIIGLIILLTVALLITIHMESVHIWLKKKVLK